MLKKPESMEECVYFTNRAIDSGRAMAWAYRKKCAKCSKGSMNKPLKKGGKPDKKALYYECNKCGNKENNEETEKSLRLEVDYKCPHCGFEGQTTTEYARKSFQGVPSFVFACEKCSQKIPLTKKLKATKKKGESAGN